MTALELALRNLAAWSAQVAVLGFRGGSFTGAAHDRCPRRAADEEADADKGRQDQSREDPGGDARDRPHVIVLADVVRRQTHRDRRHMAE